MGPSLYWGFDLCLELAWGCKKDSTAKLISDTSGKMMNLSDYANTTTQRYLKGPAKGINGYTLYQRRRGYKEYPSMRRFMMRLILAVLVVSALLAGTLATVSAVDVLDLSTLGKKPTIQPVSLPILSPTMPTIPPTLVGGTAKPGMVDLSTLGKKVAPSMNATVIKGPTPVTVTPSFAIKNMNITSVANTVFTMPEAVTANPTVWTPDIAIFGGA
jgi:hypothetical protein